MKKNRIKLDKKAHLRERFQRAAKQPPLMMLYPPVSTGESYGDGPGADTLWRDSIGPATLYIHIPFCKRRCVFCPFHASVADPDQYHAYLDAVLVEAALYAQAVSGLQFTSVYFGGGTPSVLPPALIKNFLGELGALLHIEGADISFEAHPATIDQRYLEELCEAGISRLSLGVQSFDPGVLAAAGRNDTGGKVRNALEAALAAPLREVNIDLMYGLPNQTPASWQTDLHTATELKVPSITLYSTVYLPDFTAYCERQEAMIPDAETRLAMYDQAYHYLGEGGYPQPHFGAGAFLRGDMNVHRQNVALGLPTLGLGTWSYSTTGQFAYHNLFPRAKWERALQRKQPPIAQLVSIPDSERARKYVIEAMLLAYLDLDHFRELFGAELDRTFADELEVLEELDLVYIEDGELRLTRKGGRHLREVRYMFAGNDVVDSLERGVAGL